MDQIQIGKFIAEMRKRQGLTQRQLADALSISDKTISKWECGKGLPEVSLMLPLCGILEITVNDLLTGERVPQLEYQKKAEENMMDLMKENEDQNNYDTQLSLFGDTADNADLWEIDPVTKEPIPKPIKEYPIIHYRRIAEYE